ncbi:ADP-ribosyl-[dinitrogen reductase] hydrolase [Bacillus salipaludis]|uniref:ADP-ribosyl-[dinitrogen reductase] hydrolase n=1 Tax=Bacillus salipaludis TaxID=2547811 RepID=A0A4R5VT82_9BACI|nr:ADP-ribosylglycohydrolase family protein [Bacillus salipaludis]TDK62149.1 ADP-ribosyl-[dinitrogen reductase] hydrolase [Bacillus salipaludis]
MLNKIKGALFGFAIGDALGGTTEFLTKEAVKERYGQVREIIGGGVWRLEKGETTDDTAMTLAVGRGILKHPQNLVSAIGEEFLKWNASKPKDIGNIIQTVFEIYEGDWFEASKKAHFHYLNKKSAGNGSLMRCLPVALAYSDLGKIEEITKLQSKMTHYDALTEEACVIYNRIAFQILQGKSLGEAITSEVKGTIYEEALKGKMPSCPPDGFVVNTMKWVLYWLLNEDTFLGVVIGAANEGYDSDTVAAIAGGLAGLHFGFEELPKDYCQVLLQKHELEQLALGLYYFSKGE